jgi:hypothetical protein
MVGAVQIQRPRQSREGIVPISAYLRAPLLPLYEDDTVEGCRAAHGVAENGPPISTTWEFDARAQQ